MAGKVVLDTNEKAALIARCKATKIEGGVFPDPVQKSMEIADILKEVITATTTTG